MFALGWHKIFIPIIIHHNIKERSYWYNVPLHWHYSSYPMSFLFTTIQIKYFKTSDVPFSEQQVLLGNKISAKWSIAVCILMPVELLVYNVWHLCFLNMWHGRDSDTFLLRRCGVTENRIVTEHREYTTEESDVGRCRDGVYMHVHVELPRDGASWSTPAFYNTSQ